MLNVYLLRHGETPWNAEGNRYCGRTNLPLSEKGIGQAEAVRDQLRNVAFDAVYTSPLQRASHTAQIVSNGAHVVNDARLIEADFGYWEGKTKEELSRVNPAFYDGWINDPLNTRGGDTGESGREVLARVTGFFDELVTRHTAGNVLVVGHNVLNRLYLAHKLGMEIRHYRRIVQENSAITLFTLDPHGGFMLKILNSRR